MGFTDDIQAALLFAVERHSGECREGNFPLPYAFHPIEVTGYLRHIGAVTERTTLCAALLHDVLEETSTSREEIEDRFGSPVARLVVELTRYEPSRNETMGLTKQEVWEFRSRTLLSEISKMSPIAQAIKLADRLSNLREARTSKSADKLLRYEFQTHEILAVIPEGVNPALWRALSSELSFNGN